MLGYKPSKLNHRLFRLLKLTIGHLSSRIVPHIFQFVKIKNDESSYFFEKLLHIFSQSAIIATLGLDKPYCAG